MPEVTVLLVISLWAGGSVEANVERGVLLHVSGDFRNFDGLGRLDVGSVSRIEGDVAEVIPATDDPGGPLGAFGSGRALFAGGRGGAGGTSSARRRAADRALSSDRALRACGARAARRAGRTDEGRA